MPISPEKSSWTPERIEILRTGWANGTSAGEIATELGGVGKHGVIGKAHRLGLGPHPTATKNKEKKKARLARPVIDPKEPRWKSVGLPPEPEKPKEFLNLTIYQLTNKTCKFPHGETAPFLYCGIASVDDSPYCSYHFHQCYRAPPPRGGQTIPHVVGISK